MVKTNSLTTVVWNPWKEGAHSMSDMGDDEWTQMACIEASNIRDFAIELQPGQQHTMRATIVCREAISARWMTTQHLFGKGFYLLPLPLT